MKSDNMDDEEYMQVLMKSVNLALAENNPDFVPYEAGIDIHKDDFLGRLSLTTEGIRKRDPARLLLERNPNPQHVIYLKTSKTWEKRFEELVVFRQEYGHCNVPRKFGPLGNWVQKQRLSYKLQKEGNEYNITKPSYSSLPPPLSQEQIILLDNIGFIWDIHEYKYQCNLDQLKEYYVMHLNIDVPSAIDGEYRTLYKWLCRQKEEYKKYLNGEKSKLTDERRRALENLGFYIGMFDTNIIEEKTGIRPKRVSWEERYEQLLKFKNDHGNCNVPTNDENYSTLSGWVQHQRAEKKKKDRGAKSRLSDTKEDKLNRVGFIWSIKDWNWNQRLDELRKYAALNGHCNVPTRDSELGAWVMTQRIQYGKGNLSEDRIQSLNGLGFVWDMHQLAWLRNYDELRSYLQSKDVNLQSISHLGPWIATQRAEKRYKDQGLESHMTDERQQMLDLIGFEWNVSEERDKHRQWTWMNNFQHLKDHVARTGSFKIPTSQNGENNAFAIWVRDQRRYLKAYDQGDDSPMTEERRNLLRTIGFE